MSALFTAFGIHLAPYGGMASHSFLARLRRAFPRLRELRPHESTSFALNAYYGQYTITIGPEYSLEQCRQLQLKTASRPIEVSGEVDHLFLEGDHVTALPSKEAIEGRLKATVIIHDLEVHICDPRGDGGHILIESRQTEPLRFRKTTNLAGGSGARQLDQLHKNGTLTHKAYQIIQDDIVRMLRHRPTHGKLS